MAKGANSEWRIANREGKMALHYSLLAIGYSLLLLLLFTTSASAQSWPLRTVRLILPLGPGSATDVTARLYAERLAERWGKPVVVENRPGPDALVAVTGFVNARDEHTLLFSFGGPVTINPVIHDKLPYDPERDLVPIVSASDSFLAVAASAALSIPTLDALVKRAKAEPGKLNWAATAGLPQYAFAGFAKSAGLDMVQVSYRDFSPALQDVSEGRISLVSTGLVPLLPLARAGRINILALTNRDRSPAAPEIPTATELGFPDLAAAGFQGFFGWRDMPEAVRDRIAADVRSVAGDPVLAERLKAIGQAVRVGTTADFVAMIAEQREMIRRIAK
jgi:tripartite-type tricarboxylate transporter receptor subunit TctC